MQTPKMFLLYSFLVGLFNSLGMVYGTIFFEKIRGNNIKYIELFKLSICAFIVGSLWQIETNGAIWITNQTSSNILYIQPVFSLQEIATNMAVHLSLHTFIFYFFSRILNAMWAKGLIDFQVGFGGFGLYLSGRLYGNNGLINASLAGLFTSLLSTIPPIIYVIYVIYKNLKSDNVIDINKTHLLH